MERVQFSSCSIFCPGEEATGYVVQAWGKDSECWFYLMNPKGIGFFMRDQAMAVAKKVALAMEIDLTKWSKTYPLSDFEAWEDTQSKPEHDQ